MNPVTCLPQLAFESAKGSDACIAKALDFGKVAQGTTESQLGDVDQRPHAEHVCPAPVSPPVVVACKS